MEIEVELQHIEGRPTIMLRRRDEDSSSVPPCYSVEGMIRRCGEEHRLTILEQCEIALGSEPDDRLRSKLERAIARAREGVIG